MNFLFFLSPSLTSLPFSPSLYLYPLSLLSLFTPFSLPLFIPTPLSLSLLPSLSISLSLPLPPSLPSLSQSIFSPHLGWVGGGLVKTPSI